LSLRPPLWCYLAGGINVSYTDTRSGHRFGLLNWVEFSGQGITP
jgi:hypothetical protein